MNLNEILLGDAYELIKEIPNKSVDMVYTDIPYLYVYGDNGGTSEMGRIKMEKNYFPLRKNIFDAHNLAEAIYPPQRS